MDVDFGFPGTPYQVQRIFMTKAYQSMSDGGLCILESPTGTGKSLSLICSCLAWLRDYREKAVFQRISRERDVMVSEDLPPWVCQSAITSAEAEAKRLVHTWNDDRAQSAAFLSRFGEMSTPGCNSSAPGRKRITAGAEAHKDSDNESDIIRGDEPPQTADDPILNESRRLTVFICSRTHSQITQLIKEFKKCSLTKEFNVVSLGSRSLLCVNPSISKNAPVAEINDKCRKLVDNSKCSHKTTPTDLGALVTAKVMDLEEVVSHALSSVGGCPYFETRRAARTADIVLVPYTYVIQESTRLALGIELKDSVLIFDEAHNVLDAINSSRSLTLTSADIDSVRLSISAYLDSYSSRLAPRNLVLVKQVLYVANKFQSFLQRKVPGIFSIDHFLIECKCDQINLPSIAVYLSGGDFCRKLRGFASKQSDQNPSGIYALSGLISKLHEAEHADRIAITIQGERRSLVFASNDAESELGRIVRQARAVLLVGGTMEPVDEFNIVAKIAQCPLKFVQCTNPVESSRIFARVIGGLSASEHAVFTREQRDKNVCRDTVNMVLMRVLTVVSNGGIVVFVSSFEYLKNLTPDIKTLSANAGVGVSFDGRGVSTVELLREHTERIRMDGKSLLVSVVGGSLSEGIDFKDDLCRSVILFGLPYGNLMDPILMERIKYYDQQHLKDPLYLTGNMFYEIKCMKSVAQCIGRAIRHSRDWSSIFLVDARYGQSDVRNKLPLWIRNQIQVCSNVDEALIGASDYFNSHNS